MMALPAELSHAQAAQVVQGLLQQVSTQAARVEVQASALVRFDSSALAVLLQCRRAALAAGKGFVVLDMPPRLAHLAALYGVGELLNPS